MKNSLKVLVLISIMFFSIQAQAQLKFGVRAGLNLADMAIEGMNGMTEKMITSFHLGPVAEYSLSEKLSLESGLLLSGKGKKVEYNESDQGITLGVKATISPIYLEIPVNALYKFNIKDGKVLLFAGPYFAFGVAGKTKTEFTASGLPSGMTLSSLGLTDETKNIKFGTKSDSDMKGTDFGLNFGAGFEKNNYQIRVQYGLGLSNLDPQGSSTNEMKNRVIGISLGYLFGGK